MSFIEYDFFFLFLVVLLVCLISWLLYVNSVCAEKAQEICVSRGFDNFKSYNYMFWSLEPYGVRCEYAPQSIFTEDQ